MPCPPPSSTERPDPAGAGGVATLPISWPWPTIPKWSRPPPRCPSPIGARTAATFIARLPTAADTSRAYAITGADDRLMGVMLLKFADGKVPELGYWLGEPHWGQGYAGEAAIGLLAALRQLPGFARIGARVLAEQPGLDPRAGKGRLRRDANARRRGRAPSRQAHRHHGVAGAMNVTLRTPRFILRQPRSATPSRSRAILNDFDVSGNLARVPFPYHLSDAKAWLRTRAAQPAGRGNQFRHRTAGRGPCRSCRLPSRPAGPDHRLLAGPAVLGPRHHDRGGDRQPRLVLCRQRGAPAVYSGVFHFNAASLAIQTKLGFTQTGRSTLLCLARGAEVEHIDTKHDA